VNVLKNIHLLLIRDELVTDKTYMDADPATTEKLPAKLRKIMLENIGAEAIQKSIN
jgi:hypothetical protein